MNWVAKGPNWIQHVWFEEGKKGRSRRNFLGQTFFFPHTLSPHPSPAQKMAIPRERAGSLLLPPVPRLDDRRLIGRPAAAVSHHTWNTCNFDLPRDLHSPLHISNIRTLVFKGSATFPEARLGFAQSAVTFRTVAEEISNHGEKKKMGKKRTRKHKTYKGDLNLLSALRPFSLFLCPHVSNNLEASRRHLYIHSAIQRGRCVGTDLRFGPPDPPPQHLFTVVERPSTS